MCPFSLGTAEEGLAPSFLTPVALLPFQILIHMDEIPPEPATVLSREEALSLQLVILENQQGLVDSFPGLSGMGFFQADL